MKTKIYLLKNAARLLTIALCVCSGAFWASCSGDDPADPDPDPVTDRVEVTKVELKNRQVSDEAGKLTYTDRVSVTGKVYTKIGDKTESKDVTKETTLKPEAAWSATAITISALTGEIKKPTVTGSATGLSFDFGAFKLNDAVKFTNPKYTFTEAGKSAEIPFYGFNNGEASGDPVVANTTANEGGKNYAVTTVTQKFKVKHSDGTLSKDVSLSAVFKVEVTVKPSVTEVSFKATKTSASDEGQQYFLRYLYEYKLSVNDGAGAKEVNVSQEAVKDISVSNAKLEWYSKDLTIKLSEVKDDKGGTGSKWQVVNGVYDDRLEKNQSRQTFRVTNKDDGDRSMIFWTHSSSAFRYKAADGEYVELSDLPVKHLEIVSITYGEQKTGNPSGTTLGNVIYKEVQITFKLQVGEEVITRTRNAVVYYY